MTADKAGNPVGIVGAGIVGLAVARQLTAAGIRVVVFEKETVVATHQTGHNSGVVHAGIYYAPGSAKARMTRRGVALLRAYCTDRGLAYDERGKLVVARNEAETVKLRELERRSQANGVPGTQWLSGPELRELEPDVAGVAALLSPSTAIVDYPAIARSFAADVTASGGSVLTGTPVTALRVRGEDRVEVDTPAGARTLSRLVICAGLQADLLATAAGDNPTPEIIPFRGEYLRLRPHAVGRVRRLIYPVPDPRYPFLGVHLTPRVDGTADLGPNAVLALAREGYRRRDVSLDQLGRLARSGAFWRLARQHWMTGVREMRGSLWRRAYLAEARTYLPWITLADVTSAPAGVRAQAVDPDGGLVDDFRISRAGPVTSIRNAPSPAATASMAIAEHIVEALKVPLSNEGGLRQLAGLADERALDDGAFPVHHARLEDHVHRVALPLGRRGGLAVLTRTLEACLAEDEAMTDPDDATLAAYQSRVQEYLEGSSWPAPELLAFLDRFAGLAGRGPVLEIGSGPGRDADYLEGRGVQVVRTDATPAFVSRLRDAGHDARLLDARTDHLGGPYQGIFANAVLLHLGREQFEDLLRRARAAMAPGGVLAFTLKEGDGAGWSEHKLGVPRHFTYWREPAVRAALHRAGWPDASIDHVAGRENWLYVLAQASIAVESD